MAKNNDLMGRWKEILYPTKGKIIALAILVLIFFSLKIIIPMCSKIVGDAVVDKCGMFGFVLMLPALLIYETPLEFMKGTLYVAYVSEILLIFVYYAIISMILTRLKRKKKRWS